MHLSNLSQIFQYFPYITFCQGDWYQQIFWCFFAWCMDFWQREINKKKSLVFGVFVFLLIYRYIYLSLYLIIHLCTSIHSSMYSIIHIFIHLSIYHFIYLSIYCSTNLYIALTIYLFIYQSINSSSYWSTHLCLETESPARVVHKSKTRGATLIKPSKLGALENEENLEIAKEAVSTFI